MSPYHKAQNDHPNSSPSSRYQNTAGCIVNSLQFGIKWNVYNVPDAVASSAADVKN